MTRSSDRQMALAPITKQGRGAAEVVIEFAGVPVGKARPRLGKGQVYTPAQDGAI